MKTALTLVVALSLIFTSCHKDAPTEDNGCIDRIFVNPNDHTIKSADVPIVDNLFASNGIDHGNYRYTRYKHDTFQIAYAPYTKYDQKNVRVDQFVNGLRVFGGERIFIFWNDILKDSIRNPIDVSGLDAVPHLTLPRVRKLFSDDINRAYTSLANYSGSCFVAEFGYFKKNNDNKTVKAWRVGVKDRGFPAGIYADDNGEKLVFEIGIVD